MPRPSKAAGGVRIESPDLYRLMKDLKAADKKLAASFKKELTRLGEPLRARVAAEASWSTRIPRATKVSTRFTAKTQSVLITVNRRQAPHARPLENAGKPGVFEHPTPQGGRATQRARPFFAKAIKAQEHKIDAAVTDAARDFEKKLGFK